MKANEIREAFLEFFHSKNHKIVPSAPMVVKDDPTLMFTNAGMNQFKDLFLGNAPIIDKRVADTQKCLRVSGKHNDLDEVGHDTYHHTMFEMLGNWSFGDYFKKEAIEWAWELLVGVYKLPAERMYATIFEGDQADGIERDTEAYDLWKQFLPEDHIILGNKKDNFWEMGDTGPCGPCSEIHFDLRSDRERKEVDGRELVNQSDPHVIEIWNLVFMQFNRKANGTLEPLPAQHVDTGMGFERLCMIMQGKKSNYDTDIFQPTICELSNMSDKEYGKDEKCDIAMRVIADHLRAISFSIADGQLPSNVKAGYVIRRILRRAVRYGYTYLGFNEPFIYKLIDVLSAQMGDQFPELLAQKELIKKVIQEEESSFLHTLATGINLLEGVINRSKQEGKSHICGDDAFLLYDTYGFPIDLTELIAREAGIEVDIEGFESALAKQKERSRNAAEVETEDWVEIKPITESIFIGYDHNQSDVKIARYRKVTSKGKSLYQLVLDTTPFYAMAGGQTGDKGVLISGSEKIDVIDTQKENNLTIHIVKQLPTNLSAVLQAKVDTNNRALSAANHSATHLMHEALREVLGNHVEQKGSLVSAEGLRFDFSHYQKVSDEQLRDVEMRVNAKIRANFPLEESRRTPIEEAKKLGAIMLFGEKYGTDVRVIKFGSSIELCGGVHTTLTGNIGLFKITSESAISAGVRRIEAITGEKAGLFIYQWEDTLKQIQQIINAPQIVSGLKKLIEENDELKERLDEAKNEKIAQLVKSITAEVDDNDDVAWVVRQVNFNSDIIKDLAFGLRKNIPNLCLIVGSVLGDKVTLTIMLGEEIVAKGVNASEIIRTAAKNINGGGGGQPFFATAGGKNPDGIDKAMIVAKEMIEYKLK